MQNPLANKLSISVREDHGYVLVKAALLIEAENRIDPGAYLIADRSEVLAECALACQEAVLYKLFGEIRDTFQLLRHHLWLLETYSQVSPGTLDTYRSLLVKLDELTSFRA